MAEPSSTPSASTFVIRFWQEWSAAGPRWRGQIRHVQSDKSAAFLDLDDMLDFIHSFRIMENIEALGS
ncbi:MAG: hypothetical protein GXP38_09050 [Chloroflexi bacterium]|nr:hypothetical protein [Chloroflexota bacterium]